MSTPLYIDTSAVLRSVLESGTSPDVEERIASAPLLVTSRLSHVEASRAIIRLRTLGTVSETQLADAVHDINQLWWRCETWELSKSVCRLAAEVAPSRLLRTLDALHLATFIRARELIAGLELLTTDERLRDAAAGQGSAP
ncbi:MAG: type II toxin-antitoxin system VapC family toxin [Gemmatimonadaceae bacterium]